MLFKNIEVDFNDLTETVSEEEENLPEREATKLTSDVIEEETLKYIGGYVGRKFSLKYPNLVYSIGKNSTGNSWTETVNEGGLYMPSEEFLTQLTLMRDIFKGIHGYSLRQGLDCVKTLTSRWHNTTTRCRILCQNIHIF